MCAIYRPVGPINAQRGYLTLPLSTVVCFFEESHVLLIQKNTNYPRSHIWKVFLNPILSGYHYPPFEQLCNPTRLTYGTVIGLYLPNTQ